MPINGFDSTDFEQQAAEAILGDPGLRDNLTDSEAQPLIDWAMAQVKQVARQQGALPTSPEAMDDALLGIQKIMKRVNKFVGVRAEGDPERMKKGLDRLTRLSEKVYGPAAPGAMMGQADRFLAEVSALTNEQVIQRLLTMVSPAGTPIQQAAPAELAASDPLDVPAAEGQHTAPPRQEQLTAPAPPEQLEAPPLPEQLEAPEPPEQLTAPPLPEQLTSPPKPLALDGPPEPTFLMDNKDDSES